MSQPSEAALNIPRRRLARQHVAVDDANRPLHRELVDAELMIPLHTFALGPDSAYRLTDRAVSEYASHAPFAEASPSLRS